MNNVLKLILAVSLVVNIFLVASYNQNLYLMKERFNEIDGHRVKDLQVLGDLSVSKINKDEAFEILRSNFPKGKHFFNENENAIWTNKIGTLRIYFGKDSQLSRIWIDPFAKYE